MPTDKLGSYYFFTFPFIRKILSERVGKLAWLSTSLLFAIFSMLLGGMLDPYPAHAVFFSIRVAWTGYPWWNYPLLWLNSPVAILAIPFIPTIFMILMSVGVGMSASVAILLLYSSRKISNIGAVGITPVISSLSTLGACCCTTCLTTAGTAVVAALSDTSLWNILLNNWYIDVFQLGIVFLGLSALERSLQRPVCRTSDNAIGVITRIILLIAGITWSLAMLVEWGETSPLLASATDWYHWIFEHQLLSFVAISAGLFPDETYTLIKRAFGTPSWNLFRIFLIIAAITWGIGVPPPLTSYGLGGFVNEVLGFYGVPTSLGGVAPDSQLGVALIFHWVFQHGILAAFALIVAIKPKIAFEYLLKIVPTG